MPEADLLPLICRLSAPHRRLIVAVMVPKLSERWPTSVSGLADVREARTRFGSIPFEWRRRPAEASARGRQTRVRGVETPQTSTNPSSGRPAGSLEPPRSGSPRAGPTCPHVADIREIAPRGRRAAPAPAAAPTPVPAPRAAPVSHRTARASRRTRAARGAPPRTHSAAPVPAPVPCPRFESAARRRSRRSSAVRACRGLLAEDRSGLGRVVGRERHRVPV